MVTQKMFPTIGNTIIPVAAASVVVVVVVAV